MICIARPSHINVYVIAVILLMFLAMQIFARFLHWVRDKQSDWLTKAHIYGHYKRKSR